MDYSPQLHNITSSERARIKSRSIAKRMNIIASDKIGTSGNNNLNNCQPRHSSSSRACSVALSARKLNDYRSLEASGGGITLPTVLSPALISASIINSSTAGKTCGGGLMSMFYDFFPLFVIVIVMVCCFDGTAPPRYKHSRDWLGAPSNTPTDFRFFLIGKFSPQKKVFFCYRCFFPFFVYYRPFFRSFAH